MKTRDLMLAALGLTLLAASSCATMKTAAVEQEEIITEIQQEQATTTEVPQTAGRWVDANGWDNEAMGDTE